MYSIQNFKKFADLQEEYNLLKNKNDELRFSEAVPFMRTEINDLFLAFKEFFKSKELQITENSNYSFSASYKNSTIDIENVEGEENLEIIIKLNSEEIDSIKPYLALVQYNGPMEIVKDDDLVDKITKLQNDIQVEKGLSRSYENMRIKFYNKKDVHFNSKDDVIKGIFEN